MKRSWGKLVRDFFYLRAILFVFTGLPGIEYRYSVNDYILKVYDEDIYAIRSFYDLMASAFQDHFFGNWNPDMYGRWLSGTEGMIQLPPLLSEEYILEISLTPLLPAGRRGSLEIYFNEHLLLDFSLSPREHVIQLEIPAEIIERENNLTLRTDFSYIPREVIPHSYDIRSLSIAVHTMTIRCAVNASISSPDYGVFFSPESDYVFRVFTGEADELILTSHCADMEYVTLTLQNSAEVITKEVQLKQEQTTFPIPGNFQNSPLQVYMSSSSVIPCQDPLSIEYIYRPAQRPTFDIPAYYAYYYPWYDAVHRDYFVTNPLYDDYDFSPEQVDWEIQEAMKYGIDGFSMEYYGTEGNERYEILLDKAAARSFHIIFFVDSLTIYDRKAPSIFYELTNRFSTPLPMNPDYLFPYIGETIDIIEFFDNPAYSFIDNRPAVYIYAVGTTWDLTDNRSFLNRLLRFLYGINAYFIGDFGATREEQVALFAEYFDALTYYTPIDTYKLVFDPEYSPNDMKKLNRQLHEKLAYYASGPGKFYPVLCNGYDDHLIHPHWHHPGISEDLFAATFYQAHEHDPEIIFIATWNELMEGNGIVPSHEEQYTYLKLLQKLQKEADNAP